MAYKFTLNLEYALDADNEEDAINELIYAIGKDWIEYADNGELTEVKEEINANRTGTQRTTNKSC